MKSARTPSLLSRLSLLGAASWLASALAAGCAAFPPNPPLDAIDPRAGYRFDNLEVGPGNTDRTFVIVALSGGGTRAAAFSFGVLSALEQARLASGASLLDEVDAISSVSGGSFAAAYYGAFGKQALLGEFREAVLERKLERGLMLRVLAPWNWWQLASWWYGRADLADRYYDRAIFRGKTFGDLPRRRPFIQLNATDISEGARFSFIQDDFDRLCSNLSGVHLSRGVTASSAFPVAFTPLSLRNYPKPSCRYETPTWVGNALAHDLELNPVRYDRAKTWKAYEDPARRFVHLSDGGLADNLGLRGPLLGLQSPAGPISLLRRMNERSIRRVVLIVVDAKPEDGHAADASAHPPGIPAVLSAAATNPMENYSADTVELARQYIDAWNQQFTSAGETPPVSFYRIHVRFGAESDPAERRRLEAIPTRLQLPSAQIDLAIAAGARLLRQSQQYQCLLAALGAEPRTAPAGSCPEPAQPGAR